MKKNVSMVCPYCNEFHYSEKDENERGIFFCEDNNIVFIYNFKLGCEEQKIDLNIFPKKAVKILWEKLD